MHVTDIRHAAIEVFLGASLEELYTSPTHLETDFGGK